MIFKIMKISLDYMKWVVLIPIALFMPSKILIVMANACHDGALNMCRSRNGVSIQIQTEEKRQNTLIVMATEVP